MQVQQGASPHRVPWAIARAHNASASLAANGCAWTPQAAVPAAVTVDPVAEPCEAA